VAQQDGQERTEQATPKRLREAREKGQIARSRELTTFAMLLCSGVGFLLLGGWVVDGLMAGLRGNLQLTRADFYDASKLPGHFLKAAMDTLWALTPLLLLLVAAALMAPIALGGWTFSGEAVTFKPERINPLNGLKKIFSAKSLIELVKALAKFTLIAAATCFVVWELRNELLFLDQRDALSGIRHAGRLLAWAFMAVTAPLLLVVAIDVPFQLWDHGKQLRMSRQELKDENKETEGSPEVRGRIRSIQREMARKRMMAEVPRADVVITNPTHYAVALKYDQERMRAPVVVAKGRDLIAMQIRGAAGVYKIPVISSPALSRAIYHSTPLNKEIPAGLYLAVAQILAYVYQLRTQGGRHRGEYRAFDDLPIPEELRRDG
jgi:flagellar biosynthetic protein FlhB